MVTTAVIPARGGSKGVPGKNLRTVGGISLIARCVRAAKSAKLIDHVFVSTDSTDIAKAATDEGAGAIERPGELADDHASSESALLHALDYLQTIGLETDVLVFLQCTSPFTTGEQIDKVISAISAPNVNMAFSAVNWHGFLWYANDNGEGVGVNHDETKPRSRRQDLSQCFLETGAIYVMRAKEFLKHKSRFIPPMMPIEIDGWCPEIDSMNDLAICDHLSPILDKK